MENSLLYEEKDINRLFLGTVFVFSACLFLICLNNRHLWGADEPRVAGIAAEMARTGDMVAPHLNGEPFLEQPPLYYWVSSLIFRYLGENTYTARLPASVAAVLGTVLVYLLARSQKYSHLPALAAGLVLATSCEYFSIGRRCVVDMMLCMFTAGAMLSFYQGCCSGSRRGWWYAGFVISLSGAILTKGLVGPAIVITTLVVWLILTKSTNWKSYLLLFMGIILSLIPVSIWFVFLYNKLGWNAVHEVLWVNNFGRFTGSYPEHVEPFYYYIFKFPSQFLPWSLFLPYALMYHLRKLRDSVDRNPALFNVVWLCVPFLLLSISAGKRGMYLLPLYPAAALLVGTSISETLEKNLEPDFWFKLPSMILGWLIILTPFAFGIACMYLREPSIGIIISVLGFILGLWAFQKARQKHWMIFYGIIICSLLLYLLVFDAIVASLLNPQNSFEPLYNQCRVLEKEGASIVLYKPSERIRGATVFYLKHHLPVVDQAKTVRDSLLSKSNLVVLACDRNIELLEYTVIHKSFRIDKNIYLLLEKK
jgi:4-amino-4-deoxy-L-arabinose transferase-like glycosyltransferase